MTMETGAITQYVDVAQIVLYMFWGFFAGLIYYLVREGHREGYPMDNGHLQGGPVQIGWPVPEPKVYKMADGREILAPDVNRPDGSYTAQPAHGWLGAPLEPLVILCLLASAQAHGRRAPMNRTFTTAVKSKLFLCASLLTMA